MERMTKHDKAVCRLYDLLSLQNEIAKQYGESGYNIFIFGSYLTTDFVEGQSDIDIAIYAEDFRLYKKISLYLEEYFAVKGIPSDIFYIDLTVAAPVYCAALNSRVQFTDYYPPVLEDFRKKCQYKLDEIKARIAG